MTATKQKLGTIPVFGDRMRKVANRLDSYVNLVTSLGTSRDKMSYNRFVRGRPLEVETLDALYSENDIAARVCDVVPDEELRQGYKISVTLDDTGESGQVTDDTASIATGVLDYADDLGLQSKFIEARVWGRVFGGGALLLGVDDGATAENGGLKEPLNEEAIQRFDHINVIDRRYMHPLTYYNDPMSSKYGLPETFIITPQVSNSAQTARLMAGVLVIHESRLVVFGGTRTTLHTRQLNNGWDTSVLQRMNTVLEQFGVSWQSLTHILQDASQAVFKMRGLLDALASDETGLVMQRMDMMDMARSAVRAVVLDAESEDFSRQSYSWSGLDKVLEMLMLRLAAAARMPVTVLMGQSPAGMNATGESDIRWFYDTIKSSQTNEVKPKLERILRLIMLSKSGPTGGKVPEDWAVTFPSLWQMSPSEQAEVELKTAQKDNIYLTHQVIGSEELAVSRFTPDGWSSDTQINLEERTALLEGDIDDDIDSTAVPSGTAANEGDNGESATLTGAQVASLVDIAIKVQNGELDQRSGVAIVMAAIPAISSETALALVGETDPEKQEARAAALSNLAAMRNKPPVPPKENEPTATPASGDED